jgi:hypothetical protein
MAKGGADLVGPLAARPRAAVTTAGSARVKVGGSVEESDKVQTSVAAALPLMLV